MNSETEGSNSRMIDVNNDGLDDRLVDDTPVTGNVKDIINRVRHMRMPRLEE